VWESFLGLSALPQAFLATLFTWGVTALGAGAVAFTRTVSQKLLDTALGFSAGVMVAASVWSLLVPALELSEAAWGSAKWFPPTIGFLAGAGVLRLADYLLPHLHPTLQEPEGMKTTWHRATLLILAMTLHNIPEGLAVGVAFGAAGAEGLTEAQRAILLGSAIALTIGIGLQNLPEGAAVSLPLRLEGMSRFRAFCWGQASALVEPAGGLVGAGLVLLIAPVLPYAMAFAAGAMIFVVVEELIPESQRHGHIDSSTLGMVVGFVFMMVLETIV
jgi:ZIP family zinc transporter